jgi:hypothetical protein
MMSTTNATAKLGNQMRSCLKTSETAGRPSASNATTSAIRRMNHFVMRLTNPTESVCTPELVTNPAKPERVAMSLNRTLRNSAAAPRATSEAMSQPMAIMMRKPITFGMAARNSASA